MPGIIRIGVTERGSFKQYSEAVHIHQRLCITSYSEFNVHMQNQLKADSFVGTKAGLSHDVDILYFPQAGEFEIY